ncbi:histidine ammonia-lyase [Sanyastnella coralliicola]|uniref:histidine ammonia-lyase n=1 Tax=Sanyastnella coralliicola TaxID=3069118 RepID=UPI0027BA92AA|nr:histidine ammonia-lyase [Longitalea sp. SCSIO 12813]
MEAYHISLNEATIEELNGVISSGQKLAIAADAAEKVTACRTFLDQRLASSSDPIYGINTGFGSLCNVQVGKEDLATLQKNLVLSHACGLGETIDPEVVKWMMLLKVKGLSYGHSGVQLVTIKRLIDLYNEGLLPVIYAQGSLGASGDLAPLAHLALPLIGEGQLWEEGRPKPTKELYWSRNWEAIELQAKEGLALLNGTQFMSAFGCYLTMQSIQLIDAANRIAAMSLEAFDGRIEPFGEAVNTVRNQQGQMKVAADMRKLLEGSAGMKRHKAHVQDPYSFRCIPQVHGATMDVINYVRTILEREINAVTDNPTIFPELNEIVSAGNFHGQPLALALDQLALGMHELASISERRVYKLISGQRSLPEFLVANPGLNSGFMIPQYAAASVVSQNRQLVTPSSADTVDSSNGQEDHVSMGANAATKAYRVIDNVRKVLAIELFNAAQALDLRGVDEASPMVQEYHKKYRKVVPFIENDEYMHPHIIKSIGFLR